MINPFDSILEKLEELNTAIKGIPQAQPFSPAEIIDTATLCQRLCISEPTIIKLRKKKKIPFIRIGASVRYNWPDVVSVLENQYKRGIKP